MTNVIAASKSNLTRTRWMVAGVLCTLLAALGFYVALRISVTYKLQQEMAILMADHAEMRKLSDIEHAVINQRLDSLEQTVYGDVYPKLVALPPTTPVRPSRIEAWSLNRDKELRLKLNSLERWRVETESRIDRLMREMR